MKINKCVKIFRCRDTNEYRSRYYYYDRSIVVHKNKVAKDNPTRKTQHNKQQTQQHDMFAWGNDTCSLYLILYCVFIYFAHEISQYTLILYKHLL